MTYLDGIANSVFLLAYDFDQNIKNIEIVRGLIDWALLCTNDLFSIQSFVRITQYDGPRDSLQKSQETINILSYLVYLGFLVSGYLQLWQ